MDRGFSLFEAGHGPSAKIVWTYPFDRLKSSADDGNRLLYLDFGSDDGEIVSKIHINLACGQWSVSGMTENWIFNDFSVQNNFFEGNRYGMLPEARSIRFAQLPIGQSAFADIDQWRTVGIISRDTDELYRTRPNRMERA